MTMTLIADAPVDVDAEGFLTDSEQWNEQIAQAIAAENGVPELTERHWLVVKFMRERYLTSGTAPSIRSLGKESGAGRELDAGYDGHANCFIETGFHKALLIDFNYETEPLPGHFPTVFGLPLLRESRLNHLGKLMFQWVYWHALLPGREIPGIGPAMPMSGKKQTPIHA
jgi:TusE/DsrC/DsvC family sulfur relay protein